MRIRSSTISPGVVGEIHDFLRVLQPLPKGVVVVVAERTRTGLGHAFGHVEAGVDPEVEAISGCGEAERVQEWIGGTGHFSCPVRVMGEGRGVGGTFLLAVGVGDPELLPEKAPDLRAEEDRGETRTCFKTGPGQGVATHLGPSTTKYTKDTKGF